MAKVSSTKRDRSRTVDAKGATLRRRAQRREKSTRMFLAFVFPADLAAFEGGF